MNKFIIKRVTLFLLSMLLIVLSGCGNSSTAGGTSAKATGSKLKGDFVFYQKDGATYYTNCGDIGETKLVDGTREYKVYLDEKRKNIIFSTDDAIAIKPIKVDSEAIIINTGVKFFEFLDNKYIVYVTASSFSGPYKLFAYDLDSKSNVLLSEKLNECNINSGSGSYFVCYNHKITYIELISKNSDEEDYSYITYKIDFNLCTYDFISKKKEMTAIQTLRNSINEVVGLSSDTLYYVDNVKRGDGTGESKLYKVVVGKKPELIDSTDSEIEYYDRGKYDRGTKYLTYFTIHQPFNDNGLYYHKLNWKTKKEKEDIYYFYDGKGSVPLGSEYLSTVSIYNGGSRKIDISDSRSRSIVGKVNQYYIGSKVYDGRLWGCSADYNKAVVDQIKVVNLENDFVSMLSPPPKVVFYLDKDNILYSTMNDELALSTINDEFLLNGNTIINFHTNYYPEYVEHNENCSSIVVAGSFLFADEDIVWHYKDGQANQVSINAKRGHSHITNSGNASYIRDNNLYLYANGESNLVASDVNSSIGYYILR